MNSKRGSLSDVKKLVLGRIFRNALWVQDRFLGARAVWSRPRHEFMKLASLLGLKIAVSANFLKSTKLLISGFLILG